jgi:proteasome alpha subunit
MLTPYDWQEGIGNRAQYIEQKLAQGAPALMVSLQAGILTFTYRRQSEKIFEIYDRLIFSAIGQQSDIEALRISAIEFAHREGYSRSEQDVTIQRVVTSLSSPVKRAFGDFGSSPIVARGIFGEINSTPAEDLYYRLDFDGDYSLSHHFAVCGGSVEVEDRLSDGLHDLDIDLSPEAARDALQALWIKAATLDGRTAEEATAGLVPDAALLDRGEHRENRFRVL